MNSQKPILVFKTPRTLGRTASPTIRLRPEVSSRLFELVEQTGLTPSKVIEQMLDYIGENYLIE